MACRPTWRRDHRTRRPLREGPAVGRFRTVLLRDESVARARRAAAETLKTVESLLRRAVTLDPKMTKAHLQLGILLSEQRRFDEAIPSLVEAMRLDPNLGQAHYRLAQAYQRTGQKGARRAVVRRLRTPQAPQVALLSHKSYPMRRQNLSLLI